MPSRGWKCLRDGISFPHLHLSQHIPAVRRVPNALVGKTDGIMRGGAQRLGGVGQPQGEGVFAGPQIGGQGNCGGESVFARLPAAGIHICFVSQAGKPALRLSAVCGRPSIVEGIALENERIGR